MNIHFKNILFILVLLGWSAFLATGCKKTEDTPVTPTETVLEDDDAANTVAAAMGGSVSTNGFTAQIDNAVKVSSGGSVNTPLTNPNGTEAILFDTTVTKTRSNAGYSYNYIISYSYTFTNLGNVLNFAYDAKGNWETPRISGIDTAIAALTVKNITNTAASNYAINGTFSRKGSATSKIGNKNSFYSNLALSLDSITVSKTTKQINGGSATVVLTGTTSTGKTFTKTATLQFLGNTQFKLLINGKEYLIDPATALANKN